MKNAEILKGLLLKNAENLKETNLVYAENLNTYKSNNHSSGSRHSLFLDQEII